MSKQGIIFDVDGTLWDSAAGVAKAWTKVVNEKFSGGMVISEENIKKVMGLTMDVLADRIFSMVDKKDRMKLLEECCAFENEYLLKNGAKLYPDLEETLKILKDKYSLYIVSNCQSGYIEAFLKYYGFEKYFEDIECYGNNLLSKGDNIKLVVERNGLDDACYVGDIQGDYDSSVDAGVKFIHAAYGFGKIDAEVPKIDRLAELPNEVGKILR